MDASLIIPSSRAERAGPTLDAATRQQFPADRYEILVVTPHAHPGLQREFPQVHWLETGTLHTPGRMRNLGAAAARGQTLFFADDDTVPPADWLARILAVMQEDERRALVGCRLCHPSPAFWARCADYVLFSDYQSPTSGPRQVGSAAIAVRRAAFEAVGGFDPALRYSEDWDLNLKIAATGGRCWFDAGCTVAHRHDRDALSRILAQSYQAGRASGLTVQRRHAERLSWLARGSLWWGRWPWLYLGWMGFYATAIAVFQGWELRSMGPRSVGFWPVLLLSRWIYQYGVWRALREEHRSVRP